MKGQVSDFCGRVLAQARTFIGYLAGAAVVCDVTFRCCRLFRSKYYSSNNKREVVVEWSWEKEMDQIDK